MPYGLIDHLAHLLALRLVAQRLLGPPRRLGLRGLRVLPSLVDLRARTRARRRRPRRWAARRAWASRAAGGAGACWVLYS